MNKIELIKRLEEEKIRPCLYSLDGIKSYECYCMEKVYGNWSVFYYEKGKRIDERRFKTEEEACGYLYNILKK